MIELNDNEKQLLSYFMIHNWLKEERKRNMQYIKPPLGVTPEYIFEIQRIQELTRALYEYANFNPTEMKFDVMMDWTQELFKRLESQYKK